MSDVFDPIAATNSGHPALDRWTSLVNQEGPRFAVPPNLLKAIILHESGGDATVVSFDQGCGLMQVTFGVSLVNGQYLYAGRNILSPTYNVEIGCEKFLVPAMKRWPDNLDAVVAAYNAGQSAVATAIANGDTPASACFWVDSAGTSHYNSYVERVVPSFAWLNALSHKMLGR